MKVFKIVCILLLTLFSLVANADLTEKEALLYEKVMEDYDFDEYLADPAILKSKEKLVEVEEKINELKRVTSVHPDEPRIYFAISRLYSIRGTMLQKHLISHGRQQWFAIPVVQENLQGIRDNLTQVARLLEEEKGKSLRVGGHMSSVISLQLYERFQRIYIQQNPDGLVCDDPESLENQDCLPVPYEKFALETLINVAAEYQAYGLFDDADRLLNEVEKLSKDGAAKAAELRPIYSAVRSSYVRDADTEMELSIMLPGGDPKPITIGAINAIDEHNKAALDAYNKKHSEELKNENASLSAQSTSSVSTAKLDSMHETKNVDNRRLLWFYLAISLGILILLIFNRCRKQ